MIETEQNGSGVNLTLRLLNDGWLDCHDCGVVLSNESDIAEPMRLVRDQLWQAGRAGNPRHRATFVPAKSSYDRPGDHPVA